MLLEDVAFAANGLQIYWSVADVRGCSTAPGTVREGTGRRDIENTAMKKPHTLVNTCIS